MIYLDNAATTHKKPVAVKRAMLEAFETSANAGRGAYEGANRASEYIFSARERAGQLFGTRDCEKISFSYNATHALNMAIKGNLQKDSHCIISGYEHNSVIRPIVAMKNSGVSFSVARGRLFDRGDILKNFRSSFAKNTKLVVCTHVSNVFGYILPIKEIDEMCYKKGIPLIVDASQSAGSIDIKLSELRATVCICAPGHKGLYGPQGTGILVCRDGGKMRTVIEGGTGSLSNEIFQPELVPDKFESGTMNTPGIAGLAEGIAYVLNRGTENIFRHERKLIRFLAHELSKNKKIKLFYTGDESLQSGVLSFCIEGKTPEWFSEELAAKKIAVRSGKHCSALAHETVGTTDGTVRVSVSDFTHIFEIEYLIRAVFEILRKI